MRTHRNTCFSAVQGLECAEDVCQCSKNGYWFSHTYDVNVDNAENDILKVTCVMKFGAEGVDKMFDSITIEILGPPTVVSSKIMRDIVVTITVNFYSASDIERPVWFLMLEPINDTTGINTTIQYTTLSLPVHNRAVTCKGYVAILSIGILKDTRYTVLLKNSFGETRKSFKLTPAPESHNNEHVYERTNHQYLELTEIAQERHYSDIKDDEDDFRNNENDDGDDYEEIE
ncbi:Hypothetical predicted protein [Mytilus galloprovincialis]|uniref:Uncharacterized protein n=1 Tax=Mytilus galloprovincialis TaxID=29158 RepID=A0A8B6FGM4_MYTGA|nr:Hypothetical predicted protein [Mytilus galloprovincialis]